MESDNRFHWKLSSSTTTILYTVILIVFLAASSALTPLYHLYQDQWGFGATTLTTVFAVYAVGLLLALLFTGRLSDFVGRRPVILSALLLEMVAMATFLGASDAGVLIIARAIQGVATGLATAAVGAAILDLSREKGALINSISPMFGMALGALGSTALMIYAPLPTQLVFGLLLSILIVAALLTWFAPETSAKASGALASLKPQITVPMQARKAFLLITPVNMAVWMLGGFYLSLMPSLIIDILHLHSPWLGGSVVAALTLTGGLAVIVARNFTSFVTISSGAIALLVGLAVILLGANTGSGLMLMIGSIAAGFGFGAGFLGSLRSVLSLAEPHQRASLMGVFYTESYLAHSLPTIAIGYVAQKTDLLTAVNVYGVLIGSLVLVAIFLLFLKRRAAQGGALS
ncbi:MAG: MFS transporter [Halomonas sp.]|uniref:MFS transporter n=1 Tax=Halomonas sp. TaxID=1486246 RepID=UPI003F8F0044